MIVVLYSPLAGNPLFVGDINKILRGVTRGEVFFFFGT